MQSILGLALAMVVVLGCPGGQKPPDGEVHLVFTTQPSDTSADIPLTVQVAVRDARGNVISDSSAAVTLGLAAGPTGGGLLGTTTVNATRGVATFSVHIDKAGNGYALSARASGVTGATSTTFDVSPGAASHLVFIVQPTRNQGTALSPAVQVAIQDRWGNTVTDVSDTISLALGTNPSGATLSGTTSVAAIRGVATFSNLHLSRPGEGYTLVASGPAAPATSTAFTVLLTAVTGTQMVHFITDTGEVTQPSDLSGAPVGAYIAEEDGGFTYYAGTGTDAGTFSIPGVPFQSYYLRFRSLYVLTSERDLDLSLYEQGRPDARLADAGTLLHVSLTGMSPWQMDDQDNVDDLQMYSANAGAMFVQLQYYDVDGGFSSQTPEPGATTLDKTLDYASFARNGFRPRLVDAARGDQAIFTQLVTHDAGVVDDAGVSMGLTYRSVGKAFTTSSLTVRDGQSVTLSGAFSTVPQDQSHAVDWKVAEGTPGSFGSYRAAVNPNATIDYSGLLLGVIPTAAYGYYWLTPDLVSYFAPGDLPDQSLHFVYGNPYPASYAKFSITETLFGVNYALSRPGGGTASTSIRGRIANQELLSGPRAGPLVPGVSPVQNPQLDGTSAWLDQSITPTPTVSWTPPAVGTPTFYAVSFREIIQDPTTGRVSRGPLVVQVLTEGTHVKVPPGVLKSGKHYSMSITANSQPGHSVQRAPLRHQWPRYSADSLSGLLTVP
jgi:hypothetical protein